MLYNGVVRVCRTWLPGRVDLAVAAEIDLRRPRRRLARLAGSSRCGSACGVTDELGARTPQARVFRS